MSEKDPIGEPADMESFAHYAIERNVYAVPGEPNLIGVAAAALEIADHVKARDAASALPSLQGWKPDPLADARAFYLAMYGGKGGRWEAVDSRHHHVWVEKAAKFRSLSSPPVAGEYEGGQRCRHGARMFDPKLRCVQCDEEDALSSPPVEGEGSSQSQPCGVGPSDLTAGLDAETSAVSGLKKALRILTDTDRSEWTRLVDARDVIVNAIQENEDGR